MRTRPRALCGQNAAFCAKAHDVYLQKGLCFERLDGDPLYAEGGHRISTASNFNAEPWSGAAQPAGGQEGFSRIMNKLYFNYSGEYTQFLAALTEFLVAENTVSDGS